MTVETWRPELDHSNPTGRARFDGCDFLIYGVDKDSFAGRDAAATHGRGAGWRCHMEPIAVNFSALAIATLYYLWRDGYHMRLIRRRILHQRVAYMLWSTAQHAA